MRAVSMPSRPHTRPTETMFLPRRLPPASCAIAPSATSEERDSYSGVTRTDSASQTRWPSSASSWWWRSNASWLKQTSRSTESPCESTESTPIRTWYMHGPPLISAGYVRKVSAQYPVRAAPVVRMSPLEITPSPDSPARRTVMSSRINVPANPCAGGASLTRRRPCCDPRPSCLGSDYRRGVTKQSGNRAAQARARASTIRSAFSPRPSRSRSSLAAGSRPVSSFTRSRR